MEKERSGSGGSCTGDREELAWRVLYRKQAGIAELVWRVLHWKQRGVGLEGVALETERIKPGGSCTGDSDEKVWRVLHWRER